MEMSQGPLRWHVSDGKQAVCSLWRRQTVLQGNLVVNVCHASTLDNVSGMIISSINLLIKLWTCFGI